MPNGDPNDRYFDFYFTILDKGDMRMLFDKALDKLVNAIKRLAAQKEAKANKKRKFKDNSNGNSESDSGNDVENKKKRSL